MRRQRDKKGNEIRAYFFFFFFLFPREQKGGKNGRAPFSSRNAVRAESFEFRSRDSFLTLLFSFSLSLSLSFLTPSRGTRGDWNRDRRESLSPRATWKLMRRPFLSSRLIVSRSSLSLSFSFYVSSFFFRDRRCFKCRGADWNFVSYEVDGR